MARGKKNPLPRYGPPCPPEIREELDRRLKAAPKLRTPRVPCGRCGKSIRSTDQLCRDCTYAIRASGESIAVVVGKRDHYYRKTYGISASDYRSLFVKQFGCCAICQCPQEELGAPLVVDHNHGTGEVRGLLCGKCNTALGMFGDSNRVLLSAIAYLTDKGSSPAAPAPEPQRFVNSMERRLQVARWRERDSA